MANLPEKVFGIKNINTQAIFDTIMSERASKRQGTHKVKDRSEVSGTGAKPWRQKGTGRARAGSLRSPIFVGGGRAHGPTPERNYTLKVNKKIRKLALFSALTLKAKDNGIITDEIKLSKISTKELKTKLDSLAKDARRILIVTQDEVVFKSAKNIPNVSTIKVNSLSVESVVGASKIIISEADIKVLEGMVK